MFKKLLVTLLLTFFSTQVTAGVYKDFVPANVSQIHIEIADQAEDGCWTNIGEVKRYTEDKLELFGFNVSRDKFEKYEGRKHYIFSIIINSARNGGLCYGVVQIDIQKAIRDNKVIGMFSLGEGSTIFSGQQNVNQGALKTIGEFMKHVENPQW